ncbi:MAG TPA: Ppx/GppA family phosphatase [Solirubrobacteraceae bacterium]|nr:Ppx/GppA family phosphatase [Solirubrobacteraceae bacterium]
MRVGVVDIGTNSTRLLVADVDAAGTLVEVDRRSSVTRLGDGVDKSGALARPAEERVLAALDGYRAPLADCERSVALMTSAVRDASNGREFADEVGSLLGITTRILSGDEEAATTFAGAMSTGSHGAGLCVVIDIGGGSTEFVVGDGGTMAFHVSTAAGVVRMSERHIHTDPPTPDELTELALDTRGVFHAAVPDERRAGVAAGIAVAGTATSAAAIELQLDPYDPARVEGHTLYLSTVELLLARLAELDEAGRRAVVGLHPDRAPTIIAGMILLQESMNLFGLDAVEVSERDILAGGALALAGAPAAP